MAKTVEIEALESSAPQDSGKTSNTSNRSPKESHQATYKPFSKDPLCNRRATTDPFFNYLFIILLVIWLGVCLCGRKSLTIRQSSGYDRYGRTIYTKSYIESPLDYLMDSIQRFHYDGGLFFLLFNLLSTGILIIGSLKMLCKYSEQFANFAHITLHFTMILYILIFIVVTITAAVDNPGLIFLTVPCSFVIFINFSVLSSVKSLGLDTVAIFIKKTCQSLLHCHFMILYGLLILLVELLIASFTYVVMISLSKSIPSIIAFLGGLYVCSCFWYLNQMIIAEVLLVWHFKGNEENIAKDVLWACMKEINRFHFGSAALQATYIIPIFLNAFTVLKSNKQNRSYNASKARGICRFYMLFDIADCSSIAIAAKGLDFFGAASRVHNLLFSHSVLYLGVTATVNIICFCASLVIGVISYILCKSFFLILYPKVLWESSRNDVIQIAIFMETALLLIFVWLIMATAARTTLFGSLESQEVEGEDKSACQLRKVSDAEASAPTLAMFQA